MASILDRIRTNVERKGGTKGAMFFVKKDTKKRVRLLRDMDDGVEIIIHDQYPGKTVPCLKHWGKECAYCTDQAYRTRSNFAWPIWSYDDGDAGSVKVLIYKANDQTPIKAFLDNFEEFETVTDADYIIKRTGEGFDTRYGVIRGKEGKLPKEIKKAIEEAGGIYDAAKLLEIVGAAFDIDDELADADDLEDMDEAPEAQATSEKPAKKAKKEKKSKKSDDDDEDEDEKPAKKAKKKKPEPEPEEDDDDDFDDDDDE